MIQILLKGFHQFLKSRGPNTSILHLHQAVAVGDVRRELTFCRKTGLKVCHIKLVLSLMIWKGAWYSWKHEWLCLSTLLHLHQCLFEWGWQSSCGTCKGGKYTWDNCTSFLCHLQVPFLGCVPLEPQLALAAESGSSFVEKFLDSKVDLDTLTISPGLHV